MKLFIKAMFVSLILSLSLGTAGLAADVTPNLIATAHVQNIGDMAATVGGHLTIGTTGQGLRMEAFTLQTDNPNLGVSYQGHVEDYGWMNEASDGQMAGTKGESKRIECFRIHLTGNEAGNYDLFYRSHVQNYGWLGWAQNGESSGTAQHAFRCEALELIIQPKGIPAPVSSELPAVEAFTREEGANMFRVNTLRKEEGNLPYVTGNAELHNAIVQRCQELALSFSHTRPNGERCFTILNELYPDAKISFRGENIAARSAGNDLANEFFTQWYESPSHHQNMVDPEWTYMAYAEASGIGGEWAHYGIQGFGD